MSKTIVFTDEIEGAISTTGNDFSKAGNLQRKSRCKSVAKNMLKTIVFPDGNGPAPKFATEILLQIFIFFGFVVFLFGCLQSQNPASEGC